MADETPVEVVAEAVAEAPAAPAEAEVIVIPAQPAVTVAEAQQIVDDAKQRTDACSEKIKAILDEYGCVMNVTIVTK